LPGNFIGSTAAFQIELDGLDNSSLPESNERERDERIAVPSLYSSLQKRSSALRVLRNA